MNKPKILLPVHPQWCEKIFNGSKLIEVRKTVPKIDTPFEVLVYCTTVKNMPLGEYVEIHRATGGRIDDWNSKVIGSFVCDRVRLCIPFGLKGHLLSQEVYREMCLTKEQLDKYGGLKTLYGWHITEPKLFDKPRELGEFGTICKKHGDDRCNDCLYLRVCAYDDCVDTWCGVGNIKPITRAPQSWIYCDESDD